jgi:hypothetical protein
MKDVEQLIRQIFNHFSAEENELQHYEVRKRLISIFTPVIMSLNDKYSHIVEKSDIENYGFTNTGSIIFENNKQTYFDKNENCIEFDFKTRVMTISNADNKNFFLIKDAKIENLMTFHSVMTALRFETKTS